MITGKTKTGFEFSIDERGLEDFRVLENLRRIDRGEGQRIIDVLELILGNEQIERLYAHVMKDGHVPSEAINSEVSSIFEEVNSLKNSQPLP